MKTSLGKSLRFGVAMLAFCAAVMVFVSCARDETTAAPGVYYTIALPAQGLEYSLGGRLIKISFLMAEDQIAEVMVTYAIEDDLYISKFLTETTGKFHLSGLNLQYVPALSSCQPGGLYLISGRVWPPGGGPPIDYQNVHLISWDIEGNPVTPWITPFHVPELVSQAAVSDWQSGAPLTALGSWTFFAEYRSSVTPPAGCSLQTAVELTLLPADPNLVSGVYRYMVTETDAGGHFNVSVEASDPAAPVLSIVLNEQAWPEVTRQLSFAGLDALRDSRAHIRITHTSSVPSDPLWAAFPDAMQPLIVVNEEIDITGDGFSRPLASHLAGIFTKLTARLKAVPHPAAVTPSATVKVGTVLSIPLAGGFPAVIPLNLVTPYSFKTGIDDRDDCAGKPTPGLSCALAVAMKNAAFAQGPPPPGASYILDITFFGTNLQPVLETKRIIIPLAKVTD